MHISNSIQNVHQHHFQISFTHQNANTMKTILLFIICLIIAIACSTPEEKPKPPQNSTGVFLDQSNEKPYTKEQIQRSIQKQRPLVMQCLQHEGDQIEVYYITSATGSKELVSRFTLQLPPLSEHFEELDERMQSRELQKQQTALQNQQELFLGIVKKALELPAQDGAKSGSDIWSTLRIAGELFQDADSNANKRIIYISDMVQNAPDSRRFYKAPPQSEAKAVELGKEDQQRMEERWPFLKEDNPIKGSTVKVIHPRNLLEGDRKASLMYAYWNTLFEGFEADFDME